MNRNGKEPSFDEVISSGGDITVIVDTAEPNPLVARNRRM